MYLREDWQTPTYTSVRGGFGDGLVALAKQDDRVVALSADLVGSVGFGKFAEHIGAPRLIEVGVAEQNLVTVASGLAAMGNTRLRPATLRLVRGATGNRFGRRFV